MKTSNLSRSLLCAGILVALCATSSAFAETAAPKVRVGSGGLEVLADRAAPAFTLRVSGPDGAVAEDAFLGNEPMMIRPSLLGYAQWKDGSYRYEIVPVLGDRQRSEGAVQTKLAIEGVPQTGAFQVVGGRLFTANDVAEPTNRQVAPKAAGAVTPKGFIADDTEISGSLCVGIDCIDGESFGFDTIRLKENNLRIMFDDTSNSASFPSTDWQLTANDTTNGGANRFSIEDITSATIPFTVTGGAPSNSVFVASTGRVGLGTAVPALELHISDGDTPSVRLEQTGASGWTPQTWDVAGNETNFFIRDVTGGSTLPFRIRPGAPSSAVYIDSTGNIGMGTSSPAQALQISRSTGPVTIRINRTSGTASTLRGWNITNNGDTGRMTISDDEAGLRNPFKFGINAVDNLLRVGIVNTSTVDINGNLKVNGNIQVTGTVGPDFVFAPNFRLPSIGEHAEFMWTNKHLPAVGPAKVNEDGQGVIDLGTISHGMLEELEYAHVYIAELDVTVQKLKDALEAKDTQLDDLRKQVAEIREAIGH